jgi:hypothetical protein
VEQASSREPKQLLPLALASLALAPKHPSSLALASLALASLALPTNDYSPTPHPPSSSQERLIYQTPHNATRAVLMNVLTRPKNAVLKPMELTQIKKKTTLLRQLCCHPQVSEWVNRKITRGQPALVMSTEQMRVQLLAERAAKATDEQVRDARAKTNANEASAKFTMCRSFCRCTIKGWRWHKRSEYEDLTMYFLLALPPLLFCGRSGPARGLEGARAKR